MSSKVLEYQGYIGSIETSLEDDCLYGEILFVNDLINYEGKSPGELKKAFEEAVDFYLEKCKESGQNPDRPCNGTFNVRIAPDLHRDACVKAATAGQSLNEFVGKAIKKSVESVGKLTTETRHTHVLRVEFSDNQQLMEESAEIWSRSDESPRQRAH